MGSPIPNETVKELVEKEGYTLLDIFIYDKRKWIKITCPNGHTYNKRLDGFKRGERCSECKKLPYEEVKERIENVGYTLVSKDYVNVGSKLKIKCDKGHLIEMQLNNFTQGKRCKYCANNQKHSFNKIKKIIENENGYTLISDSYVNEATKLKIKCNNNHVYEAPYGSFRQGHRCPHCIEYKGETKIKEFLEEMKIVFIARYKFEDCRYKNTLSFDFYLPSYNICIEYDGIQHFEPRGFGNSKTHDEVMKAFNDIQTRDKVKNAYCESKGIKLIRVPYYEYNNIENILKQNIN